MTKQEIEKKLEDVRQQKVKKGSLEIRREELSKEAKETYNVSSLNELKALLAEKEEIITKGKQDYDTSVSAYRTKYDA
jgi:hypothetical protein